MARRDENILTLLSQLPWWISVCVAGIAYVGPKFIIPCIPFDNPILKGMAPVAPQFAWLSVIFLFPAVVSAFESLRKRRLLEKQSGIESIRSLSWKEFEELLAEAYRRQGYTVQENAFTGPDGGIDLRIERNGNSYLVQCKQWRAYKVGVNVVREMLGLMTAHGATGGIIVTSGMFTQEARNFALGKTIDLVEGSQLADLVRNVQSRPVAVTSEEGPPDARKCPQCGMGLVVREARRGNRAGSKFLGCSGFPRCRYTQEYRG